MVDALTFGTRIRQARERQGWTQRRLASEAALSQTMVSHIEAKKRPATIPELLKIAAALGTTLGDLTGESPVRDRLLYAARTNEDTRAEEMKNRLAYYLEMDAHFETLGYSASA